MERKTVFVRCERCLHDRPSEVCFERVFENAFNANICDSCMEAMFRDKVIEQLLQKQGDQRPPAYKYVPENIYKAIDIKEAKISRHNYDIKRLKSVLKVLDLPV